MQPLWKTVQRVLNKLKMALHYDLSLLSIYSKKIKTLIQKDMCTPMFIATLFIIDKKWKESKCPLMDRLKNTYTYICIVCVYICIHT